jgi:mycofactocin system glycosyltransferase
MSPRFVLQADVARLDGGAMLLGGVPLRVLNLSSRGTAVLEELLTNGVGDHAGAALARRLVAADVLVPLPLPRAPAPGELTVCIPTHNGAQRLPGLLARLDGLAVVVVDDGSVDATADVAARAGARVIRRKAAGGPAAARNAGLAAATTPFVAFLDDDCVPEPSWLEPLLGHLREDVAAVAPRVVAVRGPGLLARYDVAGSPLDLGVRPGAVGPGRPVPYVPSAALVVRRTAVLDVGGFNETLRHGEDVDLCWRLIAGGWTVRYEPAARVSHHPRAGMWAMARQRFSYGTSAAALAQHHPRAVVAFRAPPRAAATATLVLAGRPTAALAVGAVGVGALCRALRGGVPPRAAARRAVDGQVAAVRAAARASRREWLPFALAAAGVSRRARRGLLVANAAEVATAWAAGPRTLPLGAFALLRAADDAAYGAGVWAACVRRRTLAPLRAAL